MDDFAGAIEFLAARPELTVALCLLIVVTMVLAARLITPAGAGEN